MKKKIMSLVLGIVLALGGIPQLAYADCIAAVNSAETTEQMRQAVVENQEGLGVDSSALTNMTVVYRDLAGQVRRGTQFSAEDFPEAFEKAVAAYLVSEKVSVDHYANFRFQVYHLSDNIKNVLIDTIGGFSSYSCVGFAGFQLENIGGIKGLEFNLNVSGFMESKTAGDVYFDVMQEYPTEMEAGVYEEASEQFAAFDQFVKDRSAERKLFTLNGQLDLDFQEVPDQANRVFDGMIAVDISQSLETLYAEAEDDKAIYALSYGKGDNVNLAVQNTIINVTRDATYTYLPEAKAAVASVEEYQAAEMVTAENWEQIQLDLDTAREKLAVVDESDEKQALVKVVEAVQGNIDAVRIGASYIAMEKLAAGIQLNTITRAESRKNGFSNGWRADLGLSEPVPDTVVYGEEGYVLLGAGDEIYRGFLNSYYAESGLDLVCGFQAGAGDGGVTFMLGEDAPAVHLGGGQMTLSVPGGAAVSAPLPEAFAGTVILKLYADGQCTAVALSETERIELQGLMDTKYYISMLGFIAAGEGSLPVGNFTLQQYPAGYAQAEYRTLYGISGLIAEGNKAEALRQYNSVRSLVERLAQGNVKNELLAWLEILADTMTAVQEDVKVETAKQAMQKAEQSKRYADYLEAEKAVDAVHDSRRVQLETELAALKELFLKITPYVKGITVEGEWKVGATLTAKVIIEDQCGNGGETKIQWLVGNAVRGEGETFQVTSDCAGKRIVARATPSNQDGIAGNPADSINIQIPRPTSGGRGDSNSAGGSRTPASGGIIQNIPVPEEKEVAGITEPAPVSVQFADTESHWARETIQALAEKKIISGISETQFAPDAQITRAEFIALIVRSVSEAEMEYKNEFADVAPEAWYANAVARAYHLGLVSGTNGNFRPEAPITREEMAKILISAYEYRQEEIQPENQAVFADAQEISPWAAAFVEKAVAVKLMVGDTENNFRPRSNATRAEAAVTVSNLLDAIG